MIIAAQYARENKIPYLGVCLGMQVAVIEASRNLLGRKGKSNSNNSNLRKFSDASSEEFHPKAESLAIVYMPEISKTHMGGTMRKSMRHNSFCLITLLGLGKRTTILNTTDCLAAKIYGGKTLIDERHRHRYEVNPAWVEDIESKTSLRFVGRDETGFAFIHYQYKFTDIETGKRMEIAELNQKDHPFFLGTQYHPEFLSRPRKPSPPFLGFVAASAKKFDEVFGINK